MLVDIWLKKVILGLAFISLFFLPIIAHAQEILVPPSSGATVIFIPGLEASRLFKGSNRLWEPNRNADVTKLFLDEAGESVESNIESLGAISEAYGFNVYKNFLAFLNDLADDGTIGNWHTLPYDWRFDAGQQVPSMVARLKELTPEEGTITIITHSNGGLMAKAILQELEEEKDQGESTLIDKIDRVIMVAAPQLGTPKTIGALLHGYDQEWLKGIIVSGANARELGENMTSAYPLLPSAEYFSKVLDPVIEFDPSVNTFAPFINLYGPNISTLAELQKFLKGDNGARAEPAASDIVSPNVVTSFFLDRGANQQESQATWTPPPHIQLIQIAGWGLDTARTFRYAAKQTVFCGDTAATFCRAGYKLDYRPVFTSDGDKTVVTPSATAMDAKTYYVNLFEHNKELFAGLRRNREHADISEVQELQSLIKNILLDDNALPRNITITKPEPTDQTKKLRVSVHSPVSIDVYDVDGNHTGLIPNPDPNSDLQLKEENIPNSYYLEAGEGKYVGFSGDEPHTIKLQGAGTGTFTLNIEEVSGDMVTSTRSFEDLPVLPQTKVELSLQTLQDASDLMLDLDGNGTTDFSVRDNTALTPAVLLNMLADLTDVLDAKRKVIKHIEKEIRDARKALVKEKPKQIKQSLDKIQKLIEKEIKRNINNQEAQTMIIILEKIRVQL